VSKLALLGFQLGACPLQGSSPNDYVTTKVIQVVDMRDRQWFNVILKEYGEPGAFFFFLLLFSFFFGLG